MLPNSVAEVREVVRNVAYNTGECMMLECGMQIFVSWQHPDA